MVRPRFTWAETGGGLAVAVFGVFVLLVASTYDFGTPRRMGPGFLPVVTGAAILLLGVGIVMRPEADAGGSKLGNLRAPFFVFASIGAWAALLDPAGLLIATGSLVVVAAFAHPEPKARRILASFLVLPPASALIFVVALRLPIDVFPEAW